MSATRCTRLLVPPEAIICKSLVVEIDFHWVVAKACLSRRKTRGKLSLIWLVLLIFWGTVRPAHICFAPFHVGEYVCQQQTSTCLFLFCLNCLPLLLFSPSSLIFHPISFVVCLFYAILHRSQLNHYLSFKGKIEKSIIPAL